MSKKITKIDSFLINKDGVSINNSVDTKAKATKVLIYCGNVDHEIIVDSVVESEARDKAVEIFNGGEG